MATFKPDRLKELRKNTNLTQKQFSESIGCTMASLSAYENGSKLPPTQTLINISNQYDCSIDWLMGLKDEKDYDNSENVIKTYSDYIKKLFLLQSSPIRIEKGCDCSSPAKNLNGFKGLAFCDPVIKLFLESWEKTYKLYSDSTIDVTIYNAWKEKIIRDFKYPILQTDKDWEDFSREYCSLNEFVPEAPEYDRVLSTLENMDLPILKKPDFIKEESEE